MWNVSVKQKEISSCILSIDLIRVAILTSSPSLVHHGDKIISVINVWVLNILKTQSQQRLQRLLKNFPVRNLPFLAISYFSLLYKNWMYFYFEHKASKFKKKNSWAKLRSLKITFNMLLLTPSKLKLVDYLFQKSVFKVPWEI